MAKAIDASRIIQSHQSGLILVATTREVVVNQNLLKLTPTEFKLLRVLVERPNEIVARGDLIAAVWGVDFDGYEHTLSSHINRLREKIERDTSNPKHVVTVSGVGYKFCSSGAFVVQ